MLVITFNRPRRTVTPPPPRENSARFPLSADLRGFQTILLVDDEEVCRRLAFAVVAKLTTWHAPTDASLMVAATSTHPEV